MQDEDDVTFVGPPTTLQRKYTTPYSKASRGWSTPPFTQPTRDHQDLLAHHMTQHRPLD